MYVAFGRCSRFKILESRKKNPAAVVRGGASSLLVARLPQGDVGGAVFGRVL
jgi:hypothetical protein